MSASREASTPERLAAVSPDGTAVFNVAIRTAWVDRLTNSAEYGIGGGIVWDSKAEPEWREALDKARILSRAKPDLKLLETMRWEPGGGVDYLDRHLERLQASARHFGYRTDMVAVKERLAAIDASGGSQPLRLRLLVDWEGQVELESAPLVERHGPYRVTLDDRPVHSDDEFLHHKTTERSRYQQALDRAKSRALSSDDPTAIDDAILWNERGELTETTIGNLVLTIDGELRTPPLHAGVLPGTMRADLLRAGTITEATLHPEDLERADAIHMINSVRGWTPIELVERSAPADESPLAD